MEQNEKKHKPNYPITTIRISPELKERLKTEADKQGRNSLNNLICHILQCYIDNLES